ncbi:ion transporter [Methanoculleus taiwanensis]|uniref:ion transporter n=1 Tax=Methanoculleus taiwanensis TaxID=1550565 RepID=UPI0013E8B97E|nr:ion transporter [Methanoculleus taiwanensis]
MDYQAVRRRIYGILEPAREGDRPVRRRIYEILEPAREGDRASYAFDLFITLVIVLNIATMILLSVRGVREYPAVAIVLCLLAGLTLIIFIVEYILRLWSCVEDPLYHTPVAGRLRWARTPYALIDLVVILPYFLLFFFGFNLTGLVILRVFRLFKIVRYSDSVSLIIRVVRAERDTLATTYVVLFIVLIAAATLMYQVEYPAQPEAFSDIPAAMWWGIITLTTTGYGDMVPITPAGKLLGSVIALIGIGIFALPAGILASGFSKVLARETGDEVYLCPHCRQEVKQSELWRKGE